jgi:hypothetical protein
LAEYTQNDLLEALVADIEYRKTTIEDMKGLAWFTSIAIGNVLGSMFGGDMLDYDELFPDDDEPDNLDELCKAKGLRTPDVWE